jgi:hypothetical protein
VVRASVTSVVGPQVLRNFAIRRGSGRDTAALGGQSSSVDEGCRCTGELEGATPADKGTAQKRGVSAAGKKHLCTCNVKQSEAKQSSKFRVLWR